MHCLGVLVSTFNLIKVMDIIRIDFAAGTYLTLSSELNE
jgi:hypothetical protein